MDLEKKPSVTTNVEVSTGQTTKRGLKSRHAQMLALGGTIGTALFVSSGQTLARGGPAFILGCFCFISIAVYTVLAGLTEVATWLPVPGSSVSLYASRFVSPSFGFATGWLYVYSMSILAPYEITAASLVISYWHSSINIAVWISIMIVLMVLLNALPVKFYGETEFWFAFMKVVMMTGLLIVSVVIFFGGGPTHDRLGFRYWNNPGAANEYLLPGNTGRFLALISTLTLAALPFTFAPEFLILTTGEMAAPRKTLPKASRRYIYRILFFYILSVLAIGVICPSTDSRLTSGGQGAGASPFVVGIKNAGIPVLDSIINAGILLSAWSSGNAFLYMATRSLYSLARAGNASSWFLACTESGVPYRCVAMCSLFCALAYLNLSNSAAVVFNWFVNFTNQSAFISWTCCCIVHLRFRKACNAQGVTDLPYVSRFQPWGSYAGLALFPFLALANGFDVFFPSNWSVESFLTAYIGIPLFFVIYLGHRVYTWYEPWVRDSRSVDLHSGLEEVLEEEEPVVSDNKWWSVVNRLWE
ncbi:putative proline-specific permease [Aspergillus steynii IBT 23096]|uniref:Putative proline-specific permease n=1 Tax=Aspergillus steynii IBT 23096 TaxID=1392250 RepID=A0A2I2G183_9EURO|nr:putative proline-specific permease [Aspergillus steynii IBT 23096]PLB46606.1 putative proline-specific permease [Aspergillus steynii IBT 23096]